MATGIKRASIRLSTLFNVAFTLLVCLGLLLARPGTAYAVSALYPDRLPEGVDPACHSKVFDLVDTTSLREVEDSGVLLPMSIDSADEEDERYIPLVMIVIGFENLPYDDLHDWSQRLYQDEYSLRQYYLDMSNGAFTFLPAEESSAYGVGGNTNQADQADDGIVHVTLDREKAYGWSLTDYADPDSDMEMMECFVEALEAADEYVDFAAYDRNGDGYIQTSELALGFVVAGKDAAAAWYMVEDNEYEYTWSHAYSISGNQEYYAEVYSPHLDFPSAPQLDGVVVDNYIAITEYGEDTSEEPSEEYLGTLFHELAHYLGLPDLYATDYGYGTWRQYDVGYLSLMNEGSYGTDLEGNPRSYSLDMWSRVRLGWVETEELPRAAEEASEIAGSLTTGEVPVAYTLDTDNEGEYYLFENRRFTSWDEGMAAYYTSAALPDDSGGDYGGGIIAWHINDNVIDRYIDSNEVNDTYHCPGVMPIYLEDTEDGGMSTVGDAYPYRKRAVFSADNWDQSFNLPMYGESMRDGPNERTLSSGFALGFDSGSAPVMTFHLHNLFTTVLWAEDYSSATLGGTCTVDGEYVVLETTTNITTEVVDKPSTTERGIMGYTAHFVMDQINYTAYEWIPPLDAEAITARDTALLGLSDLIIGANTALATGAYTRESFDALREAIDAANALFEDDTTTEADVAAAREELLKQWRLLEPIDTAAQEQEAARQEAALDLAELLGGVFDEVSPEAYRPSAFADFMAAIDAAYDVLADPKATAQELRDAKLSVVRAETELKKNGKRIDVKSATISDLGESSYTGKALEPAFEVTMGDTTLVEGTDYTVSYEDNVEVGTACVTITGIGDYAGTATAHFAIVASRWVRLAGANAVATMQQVVRADNVFTAKSVSTVVVAGRRDYKAAVAGIALAGLYKAPLVTTNPASSTLSAPAKEELVRLNPSRVIVVGDKNAVPDAHYRAIAAALPKAKLSRVSGTSASATAVAIAKAGKSAQTKWGKTCIVTTQASFKDAMSIAPFAYAKHAPVFFTESKTMGDGKGLSADTLKAIKSGGYTKVLVIGGERAVAKSVETQLKGISCQRLAGADAIETCKIVAQYELDNGLNKKCMAVATTKDYADALAGAALIGARGGVVVLTKQNGGLGAFDAVYSPDELERGYILGGTSAISEENAIYIREK